MARSQVVLRSAPRYSIQLGHQRGGSTTRAESASLFCVDEKTPQHAVRRKTGGVSRPPGSCSHAAMSACEWITREVPRHSEAVTARTWLACPPSPNLFYFGNWTVRLLLLKKTNTTR